MSVTPPSGSDLESMNEFYDKKFLRAVTLIGENGKTHVGENGKWIAKCSHDQLLPHYQVVGSQYVYMKMDKLR